MVNFRLSEYLDILIMMPFLIVVLGMILFTVSVSVFKTYDYIESNKSMKNNKQEFLVTGQAYEKDDPYKQTMLLHNTFFAYDQSEATSLFNEHFENTHKIMKIYSIVDITSNRP